MIDARSADLDGGGFPDLEALKAYLYKSDGAVFVLSAHILGIDDAGVNRAANAAGFACGLTNLIRLLAHDIAEGRIMLPLSMLDAHGIQLEQILAGTCSGKLKPLLAELASEARAARETARQQIAGLDPAARSAFAPLALVENYLKTLERPDHNALKHMAGINPFTRFWRLWRAS
jgi:phytoene synthase